MTNNQKFSRIKRAVEEQRRKTVQGETRMESLNEEKERIFENIEKQLGFKVTSSEELDKVLEKKKEEIDADIQKVAETLDEEGVEY